MGLIGANILVVEDNPSTRELMASLLKRMGSEVVTAGSAQEALRHLSTDAACDLVLADIVLPGLRGLKWLDLAGDCVPCCGGILLSGYPDALTMALQGGALTVPKPVEWLRLMRVIQEALDDAQQ